MNEQQKAQIEKWIAEQQSIDLIKSASLNFLQKNDDLELDVM